MSIPLFLPASLGSRRLRLRGDSPRPRRFAFVALFLALLLTGACGSAEQPAAEGSDGDFQRYALRGKVVQLEPDNMAAIIDHEEIEGWMAAMTMRFPVRNKADWEKLAVGAQIEATVFVNDDGFHLGEVQVLKAGDSQDAPQP